MTRQRQAGFTLIEVLVALIIVAVALAAIVVQGSRHVHNAVALRDRSFAQWVAQNRIAEVQLDNKRLPAGTSRGTVDMADQQWRWTLQVSETEDAAVRRLDIEVRRDGEERVLAALIAYQGLPQ